MPSRAPTGLSHTDLLQQVDWIRRLARALVVDRDLAEDLVQETCVVALEKAPQESSRLRQWLAVVLHNALRQHVRAGRRRALREALRARAETQDPEAEALARVELQRRLAEAVLALEEPARSAIVLRFFENLPPREIARRLEVPLNTVNSRLQRGLAELRRRLDSMPLDDEHRSWAVLLAPFAHGLDPLTLHGVGRTSLLALLMKTKLSLAVALVLVVGAFAWWPREAAPPDEAEPTSLLREPALVQSDALGVPAPSTEGAREPATAEPFRPVTAPSAPLDAAPASRTVRVRVLDAEAHPLVGIALCARGSKEVLGTSGSGGWCALETRAPRLELCAADPRWVTVRAGATGHGGAFDPVLVLAPAIHLAGSVRDGAGRALPGACVRFRLPEGFDTRFDEVLEATTRATDWLARADALGSFDLAAVPAVAGARLSAVLAGYGLAELEAPLASASELELVLHHPQHPPAGHLRGTVLDTLGHPVSGARVGLGLASVSSDERGAFELDLARTVGGDELCAAKAGFLPARLVRPGEPDGSSSGWPERVVLVLGGPALAIRGVVLDAEGAPVPRAKVWLHDPTPVAPVGRFLPQLETLLSGMALPDEALEQEASPPERDGDDSWTTDDMAMEPSAAWSWVRTDDAGAFALTGLDARHYRLDVLRPDVLDVTTTAAIPAGTEGVVVRLARPDVFATVEGRVVSQAGEGVPAVQLFLVVATVDTSGRVFGGSVRALQYERVAFGQSDVEGRFTFHDVPKARARLLLRGDEIVPLTVDLGEAQPVVEVERRCRLEIELDDPSLCDRFTVADAEGKPLSVLYLTHGSADARPSGEVVEGRSGVVSVSERARELRLFKNGAPVDALPIRLVAGEMNRIGL